MNLRSLSRLFEAELDPLCRDAGCSILWETDHGKREVERIVGFLGMLPTHRMCIDTNHCAKTGYDLRQVLETNHARMPVLHASNRSRTDPRANGLPLFVPDGMIDFVGLLQRLRRSAWDGEICLEYHRPFDTDVRQLIEDRRRVTDMMRGDSPVRRAGQ